MAISTTTLVCLLAFGFLMLFMGGNWWWMGVGLMIVSMAAAVSGSPSAPAPTAPIQTVAKTVKAVAAAKRPMTAWEKQREADSKLATIDDLRWRPSVPGDGICGVNPMKSDDGFLSVGSRSGTLSMDMGPVRIKDDLRIRPGAVDKEFLDDPGKIFAWHFRTVKPILQQKTKMMDATIESMDAEWWDGPHWEDKKK